MSKVETFYEKQTAVTKHIVITGFLALLGVVLLIIAISDADFIVGFIGVLFLVGAFFTYRKNFGSKSFVTLSDDGVNINGKVVILWDDIENVTEEDYKENYRYITVNKKRIRIRYANRRAGKIDEALISDDLEGYSYLKEKIIREVANLKTS